MSDNYAKEEKKQTLAKNCNTCYWFGSSSVECQACRKQSFYPKWKPHKLAELKGTDKIKPGERRPYKDLQSGDVFQVADTFYIMTNQGSMALTETGEVILIGNKPNYDVVQDTRVTYHGTFADITNSLRKQ